MKKGFVFIETLIVLVVLTVTVVGMYSMYVRIGTNIEERKYFDNISDLYKTKILRDLTKKETISSTEDILKITKDNCNLYMTEDCATVMDTLKAEAIYINFNDVSGIALSETLDIKNSMREYLKTINKDGYNRYIIVNYKYAKKNYYASLKV